MAKHLVRDFIWVAFASHLLVAAISVAAAADQPNEYGTLPIDLVATSQPGIFEENSRVHYNDDYQIQPPQHAQHDSELSGLRFSSQLQENYNSGPAQIRKGAHPIPDEQINFDEVLNPIDASTMGDTGPEPHSRHRRIIVVYPHFDFEDDHHHDHYGTKTKKGYGGYGGYAKGYGGGGYGKGYGSSTHYHPDPYPTSKYGYGNGKGKKYYRRLRGPLSPILNWYYFGHL